MTNTDYIPEIDGPRPAQAVANFCASEQLDKLGAALAKAQAEMKGAAKDAVNPHFRSSYADLASVWEACRVALTVNGLSVVQMPSRTGADVLVTTLLLHSSGQWISSRVSAVPMKTDPQGVGSAITYLRRYGLAAMVGVSPEDDDGNAASEAPKLGKREPVQSKPRAVVSPSAPPPSSPMPPTDPEQRAAEEDEAVKWEARFSEVETESERQKVRNMFYSNNPTESLKLLVSRYYTNAGKRLKVAAQQSTGAA